MSTAVQFVGNRVVVVGGGLSGLTAALSLARLGRRSIVVNDTGELGGRARTIRRAGYELNLGPHRLYERGLAVAGLEKLGIAVDGAVRGPNGGFAIRQGRAYTLPVGCCSLMTTSLLRLPEKKEAARQLASLRRVDLGMLQGVSFTDWLDSHVPDPTVSQLLRAFVRATTYCQDARRQSAAAALDQLHLSLSGPALYVHHGWASLIDALGASFRSHGGSIMLGRRATALSTEAGRARKLSLDDGTELDVDAVILAVSPSACASVLHQRENLPPATRVAALDIALAQLPNPRAIFAVGIDQDVSFSADSAVVRVAPRTGAVVHLAKYLPTNVDGTRTDEAELEEVLDLLQPGWRSLVVYRRFLPSVAVSHDLIAADRGGFAGRRSARAVGLDNVFLAGDWIGRVGQLADAAVASGLAAAAAASASLRE